MLLVVKRLDLLVSQAKRDAALQGQELLPAARADVLRQRLANGLGLGIGARERLDLVHRVRLECYSRCHEMRLLLCCRNRNSAWSTGASPPVTARLLDRNGSLLDIPVVVTEQAEAPDGRRRLLAAELPLAAIAAGDYAIEVTQGEAARVTAFRIVP